ncbi:hypothetical protein [Streptomyces sp. NPDC102360]|uniref:hypothetical protein n=1 Tax=Streptomyces sp. NPDC102360 TaxID=3366160 RepID=UPI00381B4D87
MDESTAGERQRSHEATDRARGVLAGQARLESNAAALPTYPDSTPGQAEAIDRKGAEVLFPRLAG